MFDEDAAAMRKRLGPGGMSQTRFLTSHRFSSATPNNTTLPSKATEYR